MNALRSPICTVIGHVDHGKTSILDFIRHSSVAEGEAGAITQAIGASIIPLETIQKICGELLTKLNMTFTIPGLLFIDTPGHAAFTNLRRRGGNLADIAILVINIQEGFKPQTLECIDILKQYKTPFIIAANKIDLIQGWRSSSELLLQNIQKQTSTTQEILDKKLYELVGRLSELGFNSERFDRVDDYTKQIAIIPTSAKTGEGIPELLMVLAGLAQRYLGGSLECDISAKAKGTILEVKEEKGIGLSLDVILYDGCLKKNDTVVIGGIDNALVGKIRSLFQPIPLAEMRDKKSKFKPVEMVTAATGVRLSVPGLSNVIAGMPLLSSNDTDLENDKEEIQKEVEEVFLETDDTGVIVKADSLGSLEALIRLLKEKNITVRKASVGNITKKDIHDAESNYEDDPLKAVVMGFNVKDESGIKSEHVKIFLNEVIYRLIEDYDQWILEQKKKAEEQELNVLTRPAKLQIMKGYVFRQSNPAVFGVEVLEGVIKPGIPLMKKDGKQFTEIKSIQQEQKNVEKAERGLQVAISVNNVTVGRQVVEGDILYSYLNEDQFRKLKELKKLLSKEEIDLLKEIALIMRKDNPVWGI